MSEVRSQKKNRAFTLIELMIVVAIIAVLATIAVPSYLEARMRANVTRAQHDMQTIATALEAYRIDFRIYPLATTIPAEMPAAAETYLGVLAPGMHTFKTRGSGGLIAGANFATLTTPVAYLTALPPDPFATTYEEPVTPFAYWRAPETGEAWIMTSIGPDHDLFAFDGKGNTDSTNPLSTAAESAHPAALGDINEAAVMAIFDGVDANAGRDKGKITQYLRGLTYDPTNGTQSDGDIYRSSGSF